MGNRAVIKPVGGNIGVYLHWNGGPDSVEAFLTYCKMKNYRDFGGKNADSYGIARFVQVVANYFGGGLSIGVEYIPDDYDVMWLDNGIYEIDGWDIVNRIGGSEYNEGYDIQEMMLEIDKCQPEKEQLGRDYIFARLVDPSELKPGDIVVTYEGEFNGYVNKYVVIDIGKDRMINGINVKGIPYVNKYGNDRLSFAKNINNYLRKPIRRIGNVYNASVSESL